MNELSLQKDDSSKRCLFAFPLLARERKAKTIHNKKHTITLVRFFAHHHFTPIFCLQT